MVGFWKRGKGGKNEGWGGRILGLCFFILVFFGLISLLLFYVKVHLFFCAIPLVELLPPFSRFLSPRLFSLIPHFISPPATALSYSSPPFLSLYFRPVPPPFISPKPLVSLPFPLLPFPLLPNSPHLPFFSPFRTPRPAPLNRSIPGVASPNCLYVVFEDGGGGIKGEKKRGGKEKEKSLMKDMERGIGAEICDGMIRQIRIFFFFR